MIRRASTYDPPELSRHITVLFSRGSLSLIGRLSMAALNASSSRLASPELISPTKRIWQGDPVLTGITSAALDPEGKASAHPNPIKKRNLSKRILPAPGTLFVFLSDVLRTRGTYLVKRVAGISYFLVDEPASPLRLTATITLIVPLAPAERCPPALSARRLPDPGR